MKFGFNGIFDDKLYASSSVVFITGPYVTFANHVADRLRDSVVEKIELPESENDLLEEFGIEPISESANSTAVPFNIFMDVARTPCISGKWYCRVDWKELTKKQQARIEGYIKNPSEFALLVVTFSEFGDYSKYLRNRVLNGSQVSHLVQVSFPSKRGLRQYIDLKCKELGLKVTKDAVDTFILRVSNDYDGYDELLGNIAEAYRGEVVARKQMLEALKGVENFVLDDFVAQLTVPAKSKKPAVQRKSVKMLRAMLEEFGAVELVKKLRYKISTIIQMRLAINQGIVPVRIRYSVEQVKAKLPEDSKIKGINDYSFKRLADVAALTSLRDWLWMLMILNTPKTAFNVAEYERCLFNLINRAAFSENRLYNIVGVLDNLEVAPEVYREIQREMLADQCEAESAEAYKKARLQPRRYSVFGELLT